MAGPGRPPNERDTIHFLNGVQTYLGVLTSGTGAAVSNVTTAVPFLFAPKSPQLLENTLAGRTLLIQPTAACFIITSATPTPLVVATQTTIPPAVGTVPGVAFAAGEKGIILMRPDVGWIQAVGAAAFSVFVWELT